MDCFSGKTSETDIDINEDNNNQTVENTIDNNIDDVEFTVNVGKQEELTKKNLLRYDGSLRFVGGEPTLMKEFDWLVDLFSEHNVPEIFQLFSY